MKTGNKKVNDKITHEGVTLDLDKAIERLMECKPLTEREVKVLCEKAIEIFQNESNVQPVQSPVSGMVYVLFRSFGYFLWSLSSFCNFEVFLKLGIKSKLVDLLKFYFSVILYYSFLI